MRRLLVSLGLAVIVGGTVLGAAASLNIYAPTLSAGSAVVTTCDTDGYSDLLWDVQWNGTQYQVVGIWYGWLDDDCYGRHVDAVVTKDGVALAAGAATTVDWTNWGVDNNSVYIDLGEGAAAQAVNDVHIVIRNND